jgi:hypothetical protein
VSAEEAKQHDEEVRKVFPRGPVEVSLDRVLANLEREDVVIRQVEVANDPPPLFVSRRPAVLLILDGEAIFEPVPGTDLQVAVNTSSYLFKNARYEEYYLAYGRSWLTSGSINGPWRAANNLPDAFSRMPSGLKWQGIRSRIPGQLLSLDQVPEVFVAQPPAELITTVGEPRLSTIEGTDLQWCMNTEQDVFFHTRHQLWYVLLSGRWFRAPGIDQILDFCSNDLPEDFAKIPSDHERGRVLACVPGTPQSREAIIAAHIPRTAKASRKRAKVDVSYMGEPRFQRIEGTVVDYAINTSLDVLRVRDAYYLCYQGVWFAGGTPTGPWKVCDSVPSVIYAIPPESPLFHVTYVFVLQANDDDVFFAYFPGYLGTYVALEGNVVYGTGYDYDYPSAYYVHYNAHWDMHRQTHLGKYLTYGAGYYYDHLAGRYHRSAAARSHHASSMARANPYRGWRGGGVSVVAYGGTGAPAPASFGGRIRREAPDLYAGPDGAIYRRATGGWSRYDRRGWGNVNWQNPGRANVEPMDWTRQPATQRGLDHDSISRMGLRATDYAGYRHSRRGNYVQ